MIRMAKGNNDNMNNYQPIIFVSADKSAAVELLANIKRQKKKCSVVAVNMIIVKI